jgi:hypothetical protein
MVSEEELIEWESWLKSDDILAPRITAQLFIEIRRLQSKANAWDRVFNVFKDRPQLNIIVAKQTESGGYSRASMLIEYVEYLEERAYDE